MSQSLSKLYVHVIFHVKDEQIAIRPEDEKELYAYIGGSRWIKTKNIHYQHFAWQGGYAGYSVSQSKITIVTNYIEHQKEHHQNQSFKDEYLKFLQEYAVNFDENYLWK